MKKTVSVLQVLLSWMSDKAQGKILCVLRPERQKVPENKGPGNLPCQEKYQCWSLSHVRLFVTLWTVSHQAPLSMGFSRQEF